MTFGIIFSRVDKRVSALHGTILASLCNFTSFIHKTWLFWLVESYGIFYPQAAVGLICLAVMF